MNDLQEWGEMRLESPRGWIWADFSGVGDPDSDDEGDDDEDEPSQPQRAVPGPPGPTPNNPQAMDASSDSENNAPRPSPARALSDDEMHLDPHLHTPIAPFLAPRPNLRHNITTTPTLARPTPRHPFAALSPNAGAQPPSPAHRRRTRQPKMPVLRAHLVQIKILENHQNGKDTHLRGLQIFARNDEELSREPVRGVAPMEEGLDVGEGVKGGGKKRERGPRKVERLELGGASRSAWDAEPSIR